MVEKKRALGRNLSELGLSELLGSAAVSTQSSTGDLNELRDLPIESIHPGKSQPRSEIDPESLEALTLSICSQGVIQPIVVRKSTQGGGYEIIAGERRWRAAQLANLDKIPAIIRDISDKNSMAIALIENIQRQELTALEEANAFQRLIQEFDMTHQQVADITGKSRPSVSNLLRLLSLDSSVKILLEKGSIEMGHARALLGLTPLQQLSLAQLIVEKTLSVRATEEKVQELGQAKPSNSLKKKQELDPQVQELQAQLNQNLAHPTAIKHSAKGPGKLIIHYKTLADLKNIVGRFQSSEAVANAGLIPLQ